MADLVHITQAVALLNGLIWQLRCSSLEVLLEGSYTQNIVWTKLRKGLHYMALRNIKGTLSLLEKKKTSWEQKTPNLTPRLLFRVCVTYAIII